tara:strand:- start:100 stop:417 length:318 start_codon:yes stop_codon:yes gene_type:complete
MEDHSLIMIVSALVTALGVKEIWQIIKQKIDINAKKNEKLEQRADTIYTDQIEQLTNKISQLEVKIDELIKENLHLKVKIVKMEARLVKNATSKVSTKRHRDEKS